MQIEFLLLVFVWGSLVAASIPNDLFVYLGNKSTSSSSDLSLAINDVAKFVAWAAHRVAKLNVTVVAASPVFTAPPPPAATLLYLLQFNDIAYSTYAPEVLKAEVAARRAADVDSKRISRHFFYTAPASSSVFVVGEGEKQLTAGIYAYLKSIGIRFTLPGDHWTVLPLQPLQSMFSTVMDDGVVVSDAAAMPEFHWFGTGGFGRLPRRVGELDGGAARAAAFYQRWSRWFTRSMHPRFEYWNAGHAYDSFWAAKKSSILQQSDGLLYFPSTDWAGNQRTTGGYPKFHATHHGSISCTDARATVTYTNAATNVTLCEDLNDYSSQTEQSVLEQFARERIATARFDLKSPDEQRSVSVEPSDGQGHCRCRKCMGLLRALNISQDNASPSDLVAHVANYVARRVAEQSPGAYVSYLAYNQHGKPPSIPLEDNVFIVAAPNGWVEGLSSGEVVPAWSRVLAPSRLGIYDYVNWFYKFDDVLPYSNFHGFIRSWTSYLEAYKVRSMLLESSYTAAMTPFMTTAFIDNVLYGRECRTSPPSSSVIFERQRRLYAQLFRPTEVFEPVWKLFQMWHEGGAGRFRLNRADVGTAASLVDSATAAAIDSAAQRTPAEHTRLLLRLRDLKIYVLLCAKLLIFYEMKAASQAAAGYEQLAMYVARAIESPFISGYYFNQRLVDQWSGGRARWRVDRGGANGEGYAEAQALGYYASIDGGDELGDEQLNTTLLDDDWNATMTSIQPIPSVPRRVYSQRLRPTRYAQMQGPITQQLPNWRGWPFDCKQWHERYQFYSYGYDNMTLIVSTLSNANPDGPHYWRIYRLLHGRTMTQQFVEYREFNVTNSFRYETINLGRLERGVYRIFAGVTDTWNAYFCIWAASSFRKIPIVQESIYFGQLNTIQKAPLGWFYLPQKYTWMTGTFRVGTFGAFTRAWTSDGWKYVWYGDVFGYGLKKTQSSVGYPALHQVHSLVWSHPSRDQTFLNAPNYISVSPQMMMLPVDSRYGGWVDQDANVIVLRCYLPPSGQFVNVETAGDAVLAALSLPLAVATDVERVAPSSGYATAPDPDTEPDSFTLVIDYSLDPTTFIEEEEERYNQTVFGSRVAQLRALLSTTTTVATLKATGLWAIELPDYSMIMLNGTGSGGDDGGGDGSGDALLDGLYQSDLGELFCVDIPLTTPTTTTTTTSTTYSFSSSLSSSSSSSSSATMSSKTSFATTTQNEIGTDPVAYSSSSSSSSSSSGVIVALVIILLLCLLLVAVFALAFAWHRRQFRLQTQQALAMSSIYSKGSSRKNSYNSNSQIYSQSQRKASHASSRRPTAWQVNRQSRTSSNGGSRLSRGSSRSRSRSNTSKRSRSTTGTLPFAAVIDDFRQ